MRRENKEIGFKASINHAGLTLKQWVMVLLLVLIAPATHALEFYCEAPGDVRFMRVDIPGQERLCEVAVSYQATGERRVMWYAENDSLFCSAKAYELREKYQEQWNFNCQTWPDRDGIDRLSPTQRVILDQRLKTLMEQGNEGFPGYEVQRVRAHASTPLDEQPGYLAIQYFLSTGSRLEVISLEENSWQIFASYDDLPQYLNSPQTVDTILLNAVNEAGAIELSAYLSDDSLTQCMGKQSLLPTADNQLIAQSPYREYCTLAGFPD